MTPVRSLPRVFVPGADVSGPFELPKEEVEKLRKVLRLSSGAEIAVLPNDGTLVRCELKGHSAVPLSVVHPATEAPLRLTIAQALPKGDKLDEIVRACTEIGVAGFIVFPSDRTVVRWDEKKTSDRLHRLSVIAREAAEVSFRTVLPTFALASGLEEVLARIPSAVVLSEVEGLSRSLVVACGSDPSGVEDTGVAVPPGAFGGRGLSRSDPSGVDAARTLGRSVRFRTGLSRSDPSGVNAAPAGGTDIEATVVVGPEGGWSARELDLIGDRGVTLGPRVLRVDHAAPAAAAILLLG